MNATNRLAVLSAKAHRATAEALARRRVFLGFIFAVLVLWFAEPTTSSIAIGAVIASMGEALRVWAAGHLEKSREVTRSGPYRWTRHPLYAGSSVMGLGVALAANEWLVAMLIALYLGTTIPAAVRAEEAHLREKFGGEYDAYANREAAPMPRAFSLARALANREHHAIFGLIAGFAVLALKVLRPI